MIKASKKGEITQLVAEKEAEVHTELFSSSSTATRQR
jgi:hypothetical protein|tara:strand:+ start:406 stop:516 length:111 start_codon:yes stop_codon:yes gene_type:complete